MSTLVDEIRRKFEEGGAKPKKASKMSCPAAEPVMKKKRKIRLVMDEPAPAPVQKPLRFPKARRVVARAVANPAAKEMKTIEQSAIVSEERGDMDELPEKYPTVERFKKFIKKYNEEMDDIWTAESIVQSDKRYFDKDILKKFPLTGVSEFLNANLAQELKDEGESVSDIVKMSEDDEDVIRRVTDDSLEDNTWFELIVNSVSYPTIPDVVAMRAFATLVINKGYRTLDVIDEMKGLSEEGYSTFDNLLSFMTGIDYEKRF